MKIAIVGLGLMGGSIGKTALKREVAEVYGTDIVEENITKALLTKAILEPLTDENIAQVDILILCAYPRLIPSLLDYYAPKLKTGAIICDIGGNKREISEKMKEKSANFTHLNFIACHPMAGREFTGISHSVTTLYEKSSLILIPISATLDAISDLKDFFAKIGVTDFIFTSCEHHDKMISYTSQLCHVVSSAFVKNPKALEHYGYSAGSFRDLTRVAKLNPKMWSENMMDNADYLVEDIDIIIKDLQNYREALSQRDEQRLSTLLEEGTTIKEKIEKEKPKK